MPTIVMPWRYVVERDHRYGYTGKLVPCWILWKGWIDGEKNIIGLFKTRKAALAEVSKLVGEEIKT